MPYRHTNSKGQAYYLHGKEVTLQNGRKQRIFYFAREPKAGAAAPAPARPAIGSLAPARPLESRRGRPLAGYDRQSMKVAIENALVLALVVLVGLTLALDAYRQTAIENALVLALVVLVGLTLALDAGGGARHARNTLAAVARKLHLGR